MAIAFGLSATGYQNSGLTTTATIPAVSAGDFVVVLGVYSGAVGLTLTSTGTTPTQLSGSPVTTTSAMHGLWTFTASGTDAGKVLTLTVSATSKISMSVVSYTGVNGTTPIDQSSVVSAPGGSTATHTCGTVTTVTDQDWIIQGFTCKDSTTTSWTSPGTLRASVIGTGAGETSALLTDGNAPVSLSTLQGGGSFVSGQAVVSSNDACWVLAISPASSGTNATAGLAAASQVLPGTPAAGVALSMTIQGH